jgi:hypothetical protein
MSETNFLIDFLALAAKNQSLGFEAMTIELFHYKMVVSTIIVGEEETMVIEIFIDGEIVFWRVEPTSLAVTSATNFLAKE